jgi:alkylated DNA repair dioxygenase AlkB
MTSVPATLFEASAPVPPGFRYVRDFVSIADEAKLVDDIGTVTFSAFEMRGVVARRRVAFFGQSYEGRPAVPIPAFLMPLRAQAAQWAGLDAAMFAMALINEYPPGAPIGWHRDAPQYDIVVGISLLSDCRMKFRPYVPPGKLSSVEGRRIATHEMTLERRSAYLLAGESRTAYEHHIPPVSGHRYSITFRTLRA